MLPIQFTPKPKRTYTMFRMWMDTRDRFKMIGAYYGMTVIELLDQLSIQMLAQITPEAKVDNPNDRQFLQDTSEIESGTEAVADPETVEPERTSFTGQEREPDGTPVP